MAIFHLNAKVISRGKGQSAIAAAAYRSGDRLRDEQANEQKFYKARAERIEFTDIMAPSDAPEWAHDRNRLWNEAERAEKRKDAQLAREFEIALPHELTDQQRQWLVKDFAREAFVRQGYAVDIAIHAPDKAADERNHHAHLMVTMRALGPDGFAAKKDRSLNSDAQLATWREQWAHLANRHLERHGHEARIDHRSLKAQGIDREPGVHLGYAVSEMAARGAQSDRMDELQAIIDRNEIRLDMKAIEAELRALEKEQTDQQQKAAEAAARAAGKDVTPIADVQARHAAAEAEKVRQTPEAKAERQETRATAAQEAWRSDVAAQEPKTGAPRPVDAGLHVVDGVTGAVSKLGDFMLDFLSGSSAPAPERKPDMKGFVTDPAARKEQQLARLASARQAEDAEKAIERIAADMKAGKNLKSEDIRHLTRQHQEQIRTFGDTAVQQMVDESRKRSEKYWKGEERERE